MIKLIALDLDGTLLSSDKTISNTNKEAIQAARKAGIRVVLCTGRAITGIQHLLEELDMTSAEDICITYNGGVIQNAGTGDLLYEQPLLLEDIAYIFKTAQQVALPINMLDLEAVYEPPYPQDAPSLYSEVMPILSFQSRKIEDFPKDKRFNKVVICRPKEELDMKLTQLPEAFYQRYECVKSRPVLLEVLPKDVTKGKALKQLAFLLHLSMDEVMACGDEENDLSMIEAAGFGVAMGNAIEEVKQVAQFVTASCDDHGVAKAIYKILGE